MRVVIVGCGSQVTLAIEKLKEAGKIISTVNMNNLSLTEIEETIIAELDYEASAVVDLVERIDSFLITADERILMMHPELSDLEDFFTVNEDFELVPLVSTTDIGLLPYNTLFNAYITKSLAIQQKKPPTI